MKILLQSSLLIFLAIVYRSADCQVIDATICDSTTRFPITQYSSYLQTTKLITIDSVIKSSDFIKSKSEPVSVFNYDPYYYWFRIIIKNNQDISRQLLLLMAPVGMYDGKLFQKIDNKWQQVAMAGLKYKFKERSYQFTHHVFPFMLPPKSLDTLYVSIDASNVYKLFGFALIKPKDLKIFESNIYFIFGIIVGLLLLFFVLNVSLFFALKDNNLQDNKLRKNNLHLWYALYIALLFLIVMKNDQLDQQFLGLDSERAFRLTPYAAIGAFAIAVLMHVVQGFLGKNLKEDKWIYCLNIILKINVLTSAVVHSFVFIEVSNYHIQNIVFNWEKGSIFLCISLIIVDCFYFYKKVEGVLFLFCGSFVFMIGAVQRLFFPTSLSFLFPPTTFHVGIILETFVISLGLIYKYWLDKEKERRKTKKKMEIIEATRWEIQEQTFKNISLEIHDNIGQVLSLVKLNINTMDAEHPKPLQEKIDNSRTLITKAIQDLRDLSKSLNTDFVVELGLMRSIEYELEMIQKTGSYDIQFHTNGKAYRLERQQELIIFRTVQEVLHNIIKHAKATKINVTASFDPGTFILVIADNGQGFDASKIESDNYEGFGLGLRNMNNRAKTINASFKLTSTLKEGTAVTITLPIQKINNYD